MRNRNLYNADRKSNSSMVLGTVFVIAGLGFLFRELFPGLLPYQFFTWQSLLIIIGLSSGIINKFKGFSWLVLIIIGVVFSTYQLFGFSINAKRFIFPGFMIVLGIIIFNRNKMRKAERKEYQYKTPVRNEMDTPIKPLNPADVAVESGIPLLPPLSDAGAGNMSNAADNNLQNPYQQTKTDSERTTSDNIADFINLNSYFASNERIVTSKSFQGGRSNTAFASSVIDLHNADFDGVAVLDVFCIFGSVELIIPNNWCVKNEATALLGAVEDSRRNRSMVESNKVLVIKGTVIMGSLEVKH